MVSSYSGWIDPKTGRRLCAAFNVGSKDLMLLMRSMRDAMTPDDGPALIGPPGPPGMPGPVGKSLHTGYGPPQDVLGHMEDTYVDVNTGDVYVKE